MHRRQLFYRPFSRLRTSLLRLEVPYNLSGRRYYSPSRPRCAARYQTNVGRAKGVENLLKRLVNEDGFAVYYFSKFDYNNVAGKHNLQDKASAVRRLFASSAFAMRYGASPRAFAEDLSSPDGDWKKKVDRFKQEDRATMFDVEVLKDLMLRLANECLSKDIQTAAIGGFLLSTAVELGNEEAAVSSWFWELHNKRQPEGMTRSIVKDLAQQRKNAVAMSLYLDGLLKSRSTPSSRAEAYSLAKDLYELSEPDKGDNGNTEEEDAIAAPWKQLRDAAVQQLRDIHSGPLAEELRATRDRAIFEGATKYNDPEACIQLANEPSIKVYSKTWLDLKTKAAMYGNSDACFDVGKYWLEKDGWPWSPAHNKHPSKGENQQLALEWLELAASLAIDNGEIMTKRFLAIALILRESGNSEKGHTAIRQGINALRESEQAQRFIDYLSDFDKDWNSDFRATSAQLLGEPLMGTV